MAEENNYVWCTYRDWSFKVLEGLQSLEGWKSPLVVTTKDCVYDFSRLEDNGVEILRINPKQDLKEGGIGAQRIAEIDPKTIFHYGWSWIVPENLLDMAPNVTLHPGKLPKDRGGSPLQNQIRNGETWTYANVMQMSKGLDEGPVYMKAKISLEGHIDDVWSRMISSGIRVTRDYLQAIADGIAVATPQDLTIEPTEYKRVKPSQAEIKPEEQTALEMYNIIRAHAETDPNTYVVPAFMPIDENKRLVFTNAKQTAWPAQKIADLSILEKIDAYDLAERVNNNEAMLGLTDSRGEKVYVSRMIVQDY